MATYLTDEQEIYDLYTEAEQQSNIYRKNYPEFERLADNEIIDDLDESLPEVNDGTLAASLYKLPKRIVNSNLKGRAKSLDRDEAWVTELANIQIENKIIPNANSQAPFIRKWKDAVRKAAIYGSVPLITLFVERGDYVGSDFIVAQPQDVLLEPGKVSDYDSDVFFWDVYFTKQQVRSMIERAKRENKEAKENPDEDSYNKWDIKALEEVLNVDPKESRDSSRDHSQQSDTNVVREGIKFCVVMQRGVDAPFYMYHKGIKKNVREWSNPDPTGDVPVHFLYCYQDFVNPYGVGICKLAGGTQNVLDYMRQADILATQLGFRPPMSFKGDLADTDFDSFVYAQDAQWIVGNAEVKREEISSQIYQSLPARISMYKISLDQLMPSGDTSINSGAGDTDYSKTPAGVKFQQNNLSIDDEDFKDNLYMTYEAVMKSMINIEFANMQGTDLARLSDEEREVLSNSGLEFPIDPETGEIATNELEIIWDEARSTFDFEIDAEQDKAKDEEKRLEGLMKVAELRQSDPMFDQKLMAAGKKINDGELYSEIVSLTSDNKKIIEDVTPEDGQEIDPTTGMPMNPMGMEQPMEGEVMPQEQPMSDMSQEGEMQQPLPPEQQLPEQIPEQDELMQIQDLMESTGANEGEARAMIEAEKLGYDPNEVLDIFEKRKAQEAANV